MVSDRNPWERPAVMGSLLAALIVVGLAVGAYAGSSVADSERDRLSECAAAQIAALDRAAAVTEPIGTTPAAVPAPADLDTIVVELTAIGDELEARSVGECRASSDPGFLRRVTQLHQARTDAVTDLRAAGESGDAAAQQAALDRLSSVRTEIDVEICAQLGCESEVGPPAPSSDRPTE
ncbi:hypothetical protein [Rhabdothermincola salaria]|uniref:hypothetical protein n=1 Tax=Rhabdothermincola salaria TaxID=2903142 RepID=UPI001E3EA651|nr:hypothetical protein [Rhabdothermincola salaria]MCD9624027.1 hypothetical protein [Rhabdothermincola salaria]